MGLGAGVSLLGSTAAAVTAPSSLDGAPGIPLHAVDVVVHDGFGNPLGNQSFVVRAAVEAGTLAQARLVGQLVAVSSGGMCVATLLWLPFWLWLFSLERRVCLSSPQVWLASTR